jgi:2,4-dienoyl-CoA reductase-like NADH-dependent reductase (Old Yellow Enzyme family)
MSKLYTPYTLRGIELSNRIVVSPMCQYSSEDGMANDWHLVHLGSRAVGGAGLVFTEAAAVSPVGRITPSDLGLWKDEQIAPLKQITRFIKAQGAAAGIQLSHAGRKASCQAPWEGGTQITAEEGGWKTVAPSPLSFYEDDVLPHTMTIAEIEESIASFITAAKRAVIAGFDVIEIHAAHGYLINQFISPLTNKRLDAYGGSFEKRVRFLMEVTEGIRSVVPAEMPVFVRISAEEWMEEGHTLTDSVRVAELLKAKGVDLIDCSSGGVVSEQHIIAGKNYQVPFAEKIRKEAGIPTGAVGLITTAHEAEAILEHEQADLIFLGREMLRNPYFALLESGEMNSDSTWPKQYERAKPRS